MELGLLSRDTDSAVNGEYSGATGLLGWEVLQLISLDDCEDCDSDGLGRTDGWTVSGVLPGANPRKNDVHLITTYYV